MANLGSELIRFFALRKRGEEQNALASATRARKIIQDMSAREDIGNGKQELVILEKIIEDALSQSPQYRITDKDLNSYFMPFASRTLAV